MKNTQAMRLLSAVGALFSLLACSQARAAIFNVKDPAYGAVGDGVHDDTKAIQQAVDQAIKAGAGNTVLLPAGTFLLKSGAIKIIGSTNLTFTGAGAASTMLWFTRTDGHVLFAHGNTNFTFQNFSSDVQKLTATGLYDLGSTQGTITSIDAVSKQITVQVENGYPLMNRPDIQKAPTNDYGKTLWLLSDPTRMDFDGYDPTITAVAPSPDGKTAVLTLKGIGPHVYVGEQWLLWPNPGGVFIDIGYGNSGTTTLQNIDYYGGGAVNWMGIADNHTGTLNFNHLYCGPPPYQPDRLMTCNQGWAMNGINRATINISNSTFLRTWDDVFDIGCAETVVQSQPAPNQVIVPDSQAGDYRNGDAVEFTDDTQQPVGNTYGQSAITAVSKSGGNWRLTLSRAVTIKSPGKDYLTDLTQAGPVTATNCTFNNTSGRHVYFRSGISVTVKGCTFKDGTPLIIGGWDGSEGPSEVHNVTVTGNTFLHSDGVIVDANGGASRAVSGSNVTISGNRFLNCGRYGQRASEPVVVKNVAGVTVANNWFDNNWDANALFQYDANVTVTHNTFLYPNEVADGNPPGASVIHMEDVADSAISGNIVDGAGPYTYFLNEAGKNVTGVTGLKDGTRDIDNPVSFFPVRDKRTRGKWTALPSASAPGSFTLQPYLSGQSVGSEASSHSAPPPAQTWTLASLKARNVTLITPPTAAATQQFGTVTVSWAPVPSAVSYSVGRSMTPGGPYTPLASGLRAGPYVDSRVSAGTPYYYVITAAGLPAGSDQSNEACAVPNADYVPVNMASAFNITVPEPHGRYVRSFGRLFILGAPGKPNAASDVGQRIVLPLGFYARLLIFGAGAPMGPFSAGAFHVTVTYADGSSETLGRGATLDNATSPHGFPLRLDPTKSVAWLTLPKTGQFRILAMDLSGANLSTLAPGQSLLPGQYLVSPNGKYCLTQQSDGSLALCRGSDPSRKGTILWSSGQSNAPGDFYTALQDDGNLVTYPGASSHSGKALWSSDTWDKGVTGLQVTDTGQVQLLSSSTVVWEKP